MITLAEPTLLSCPFCGGVARIEAELYDLFKLAGIFRVTATHTIMDCPGGKTGPFISPEAAASAWNRRKGDCRP